MLAVAGPTATGKTALGVELALRLGGEIISADSMQIYRGLDIGTAKVTPAEMRGVPHHGLDILPPEAAFSVADFTAMAGRLTEETARALDDRRDWPAAVDSVRRLMFAERLLTEARRRLAALAAQP